ncbi:MAG: dephospho-CoA kinase [Acidimicrobiales bacterium]
MGLTGGIGSGKSTVSSMLAERGAVIVDADQVVRDVQQPGSPVLAEMAERFGSQVIAEDGSLDRAAVAAVVFSDPEALKDLNKIVHPAVGREMNRRVLAERDTDHVVVMDIPLLTENPREGLQAVIVIDVDPEVQVRRLVQGRGFDEADARARIAKQASREQRLATATHVIDNSGSPADLVPQVDALYAALTALPQLPADWEMPAPKPKDEAAPEG